MSSLIPGVSFVLDPSGNYASQTVGVVPAATNASGAATSTYAATLQAGLNPSGIVTVLQLDASGAAISRTAQFPSMSFVPSAAVATGATAGKSMLSAYNAAGSGFYQRVVGFYAMCPPQYIVAGGSLGAVGTSYTTISFSMVKFTSAHTGGSAVTGALHDTRDTTYDTTNFTVRSGATVSNAASIALNTFDAAYAGQTNWAQRLDDTCKLLTMAPGEGINFVCNAALGNNGVNFLLRLITEQAVV